ncbi:homeodomain-like protein [Tanacetum coccineum]
MTRSSTKELFTPFKDPEREFRSSRKHFKTLSLDESRSPDFDIFSDQEEYSEGKVAETMAETMEQYMSKTRADYGSGGSRPKIEDNDNFELKCQYLKELRTNSFSGSYHEEANEHIEKILEIMDLFYIPNIIIDQVMIRAFPMSLTRAASRWLRNKPSSLITTWEDLKTKFLSKYCPHARTTKKMEEINNFQQILDSRGAIPSKTTADAKVAIQEMVEYSQKWHNVTSRTRSTETSDGLAAIQAKLNNLGREIKKVNEKVYAAQVGCKQCKGPHYTKDFPLKEEGKTLEEAYYMQFGRPFQGGGYRAAPRFYQRNNVNLLYQERRQSMEDTLRASVGVMPLSTYLNLGLGELAHTKLTVELADRTMKYPKGIAKNVLVGEVIEEFKTRDDELDTGIDDYPSYCDHGKFLEDMDAYRNERMGDVIFGEPFLREVGINARRFNGMITIYNGNDEVTYQMVRSHPRFKYHTNKQCNKIPPLLKVSEDDMMNGILHSYQKLKREIKHCTYKFLSEKIFEQVRVNPDIPVKAVQDQLQHEFESTNPNTTIKISLERNTDPSLPNRVFQRIYVCLGALKLGFRACRRDLLGLDGASIKGPFPGKVLVAVGLDSNKGIYPLAYALVEAERTNHVEPKSDLLLNNICEVFNGKIVGGRDKPMITLLKYIKEYCMKIIVNVQGVIDKCTGPLTPTATRIMESIKKEAYLMKVQCNGANKYQVSGSLGDQATSSPETWVNPCYWLSTWKEAYSHKIQPVCKTKYWEKSTCPTTLLPPTHHVQVGRPRKKRKRSKHEDEPFLKDGRLSRKGRTITCQSCGNTGHNKATCKGQGRKASTGGNNAETSVSASRQAQQTKPAVGQDGSGGSGAGVVIGLSTDAGDGGTGDAGVASQGSSYSRWKKRRAQTERISP